MKTWDPQQAFRHRASRTARREAGQSRRRDLPLEDHAELGAADTRHDPVEILRSQDEARLAELVPIRYGRMSRNAFTFYRGAAAIMAADLGAAPHSDLDVQLCGDAHLSNFGVFNSPDRHLIFDMNDFDETLPGPFEWDLKRLAASASVAGRENGHSDKQNRSAARAASKGYRKTMNRLAQVSPHDLQYFRLEFEDLYSQVSDKATRKRAKRVAGKAQRKDSLRALDKLTDIVDGRRVIVSDPPLVVRLEDYMRSDEMPMLVDFFERYRESLDLKRKVLLDRYSVVDVASKVVGVGSVGMRALIMLLESGDGDPLFLQFKEATTSVLEPYLKPSEFDHAGQRVVEGQRLTQAASDVYLGWSQFKGTRRAAENTATDFYFRQLWDGKGSAAIETMDPKGLKLYSRLCGSVLALAHARSGDAAMIAGYVGDDDTLDRAIGQFAESYADLNQSDYDTLTAAIDSGGVAVERDI